jgi:PBSX family phage terminase large subunit
MVNDLLLGKSPQGKIYLLNKIYGLPSAEQLENDDPEAQPLTIPADMIAPDFFSSYRAIRSGNFYEFLEEGGRGSTKSSFVSLAFIELLINNPEIHGLASRQVGNTMRDSVFAQLQWAIGELGLTDSFKCITNPTEIVYTPTEQKIYFRGLDDAGKIKSITPVTGYIGLWWLEEADQARSPEPIRKVEQSLRGGDKMWFFKSWNTPRPLNHWINRYVKTPKEKQHHHKSTYLTVPPEWLGEVFIMEAEHLREVNPDAYSNEYMGIATGTGGQIFENVELREITDKEIAQFDNVVDGVDWGYYPSPFAWVRTHYDHDTLTLYSFDEMHAFKKFNNQTATMLKDDKGVTANDLIIADSSEPKSVADFQAFGLKCRGAEKGSGSREYATKWLQGRVKWVIDPVRCPHTAKEALEYEHELDKNGDIIDEYPDKNDHFIDATKYSRNLNWRKGGK